MEEKFDLNRTQVSGIVQRIWDYGEDIFVRLEFYPDEDRPPRYVTLKIPNGMLDGEFVTIQPGELVQVEGYLEDVPYLESMREFFSDAKAKPFYVDTEQAAQWEQIEIERVGTQIVVTTLASLTNDPHLNAVMIQGIITRSWKGGADLFARLAVYDANTEILQAGDHRRWPKRKPHYLTVRIIKGELDGKKIALSKRNRIRVSGVLHIHFYRQSLAKILERAGQAALVQTLPASADDISALRDSLYVVAHSLIVLASRPRKPKARS